MTETMKLKAAKALMQSCYLIDGINFMPKVYIVGRNLYWFAYAARRAAICENRFVEVMQFEEAYQILNKGLVTPADIASRVKYDFNQTGDSFGGYLFYDNPKIKVI